MEIPIEMDDLGVFPNAQNLPSFRTFCNRVAGQFIAVQFFEESLNPQTGPVWQPP